MAAIDGLDPRDWRDVAVLQAQGVRAELLGVDVDQADRGLRRHATLTGETLYDVAWQVVHLRMVIARDLCR
jgi:hypothetical protein